MMNILQTIWTALTTENIQLVTMISVPLTFIECIVAMLLFTTILNIQTDKKDRLKYVLLVGSIGIIARLLIPGPYNAYINVLFTILSIRFILKSNWLKSILGIIIPFLITAILESLIAKVYPYILGVDYMQGINIPINRLLVTLFIYLMVFAIYKLIKYLKLTIPKLEILNKKKKTLLIFNVIFGLVLIGTQIYIITFYISWLPFGITVLNILSLIAYFGISIYTLLTTSQLETTTMNLEEAQLYNKTLQILHDNIRAFKHDFWNIIQGIGGYVGKDDMEGLKSYYSKLVEDCQQVNNLTALSPSVVNNPAIYNILANKYHIADELGIKINLEVFMDLNELNINSYELTRILGILMNNAIEASKECEDKIINVTFRKDKKKNMQLIVVENTYMDKNIDTEKIYEKGYSTKEGNTGLGLWEIRQIMKKHNNLNLFTSKTGEFFSQQFEIYY